MSYIYTYIYMCEYIYLRIYIYIYICIYIAAAYGRLNSDLSFENFCQPPPCSWRNWCSTLGIFKSQFTTKYNL